MQTKHSEIGRELRVSELQPRTIVVLQKVGSRKAATMWVEEVFPEFVIFSMGAADMHFVQHFLAQRTGHNLEQITDDTGRELHIHEYLGEP